MADEKAKPEEFEILEVGADGKPLAKAEGADTQQAGTGSDTQAGAAGADELDDDDLDERVALSEEDRASRKEERKLRADRRREQNRRRELELVELRRNNDDMAKRLAAVEGGQSRVNVALLNDKLNQAEQQLRHAENLLTTATANAAKDPGRFTEALRLRDDARDAHRHLAGIKQRVDAGRETETRRTEETKTDIEIPAGIKHNVAIFQGKHPWYDPQTKDEDSAIVQALDETVNRAGYDPNTREYWDELERRIHKALPHRFKSANGAGNGTKSPPIAGAGEGASRPGTKVVRVTPERRKAMEEAGVWDDPTKRQKQLKAYAEWDRQHPTGSAAR